MKTKWFFAFLAFCFASAPLCSASPQPATVIAKTGDGVVELGTVIDTFAVFDFPLHLIRPERIDELLPGANGFIFLAALLVGEESFNGIVRRNSPWHALQVVGDPAPGFPGEIISQVFPPLMDHLGNAIWVARVSEEGNSQEWSVLYAAPAGGTPKPIAYEEGPAQGGGTHMGFFQVGAPANARVPYTSVLFGGMPVSEGIYLYDFETDSTEPLANTGGPVPEGDGTYIGFGDRPAFNGHEVAFAAFTTTGTRAIQGPPGALKSIGRNNHPVGAGREMAAVSPPLRMNAEGYLALQTQVRDVGGGNSQSTVLVHDPVAEAWTALRANGDPTPSGDDEFRFLALRALGNSHVAYTSGIQTGGDALYAQEIRGDQRTWRVAQYNDTVWEIPGAPATRIASIIGAHLNENNGGVFMCDLQGTGVTAANNKALLYFEIGEDGVSDPVVVVAKGQPFEVADGDTRTISDIEIAPRALGPHHLLAVLKFTDGTSAAVAFQISEPGEPQSQPPQISGAKLTENGTLSFQWLSRIGDRFRIEIRDDLSGDWKEEGDEIIATGDTTDTEITINLQKLMQLFRVRQVSVTP